MSGSEKVQATDITCGLGHGISIRSLRSGNSEAHVSDITVNGAKISGTTQGTGIKTWQRSAVQVKNVLYQNIKGASASNIAIKFDCSYSFPCHGIVLQNVDLVGKGGATMNVLCNNVRWTKAGDVSPLCPKSN